MANHPEEWLRQSEYDLDTAGDMAKSGRNLYAIFMCHLAVEKALKGLYHARLDKVPPKTHDLLYLAKSAAVQLPEEMGKFTAQLNTAGVVTRYPENLKELLAVYTKQVVESYLKQTEAIIRWAHEQYQNV